MKTDILFSGILHFGGTRVVTLPVADQYVEMLEGFSRAVRGQGPMPTPPQDAIDNMKAPDVLFRSEISGSWEKVGL